MLQYTRMCRISVKVAPCFTRRSYTTIQTGCRIRVILFHLVWRNKKEPHLIFNFLIARMAMYLKVYLKLAISTSIQGEDIKWEKVHDTGGKHLTRKVEGGKQQYGIYLFNTYINNCCNTKNKFILRPSTRKDT